MNICGCDGMRDNYDFSDAIKNPFAGREKGVFVVKVHYELNKSEDENGKQLDYNDQKKTQTEAYSD